MEINSIKINKNRGWRGLAEIKCYDTKHHLVSNMVFSFSQKVWDDLLLGKIVIQDNNNYYLIDFNNTDKLPKPTQQRSVLIKNFEAEVRRILKYPRTDWNFAANGDDWLRIKHFVENKNNHTTSDWNCIGIRVVPEI